MSMNVTSVTYIYNDDNEKVMIKAVIDGKNLGVPIDESNRHYVVIKEWLDAGNSATN
tara:strand:- start:401 stop:571 length:171 start_codon:yes stop_codon:yes gene_type:complete